MMSRDEIERESLARSNMHACMHGSFLGALAKLRKTAISFVMSDCPSLRPRGTTRLPLDGFS